MAAFIPSLPRFPSSSLPSRTTPPQCALSRRNFFLLPLVLPLPALADRTGKFSTKLTAKRRYLPRIARGITLLNNLHDALQTEEWRGAADDFLSVAEDMETAMQLFATTYFSEGNKISEREKSLALCVQEVKDGVGKWNGKEECERGCKKVEEAVGKFVEIAGVAEYVGNVKGVTG